MRPNKNYGIIQARWHESYEPHVWPGPPNMLAERAYKELMTGLDLTLEKALDTCDHEIYRRISRDLGRAMEFPYDSLRPIRIGLYAAMTLFRRGEKLIWGEAVDASKTLLLSSLIRGAKEQGNHEIALSRTEWAELAFDDRDIAPDGQPDEGYFAGEADVYEEESQRKLLGYCALKMIESGAFNQSQMLAFIGEVATITTK